MPSSGRVSLRVLELPEPLLEDERGLQQELRAGPPSRRRAWQGCGHRPVRRPIVQGAPAVRDRLFHFASAPAQIPAREPLRERAMLSWISSWRRSSSPRALPTSRWRQRLLRVVEVVLVDLGLGGQGSRSPRRSRSPRAPRLSTISAAGARAPCRGARAWGRVGSRGSRSRMRSERLRRPVLGLRTPLGLGRQPTRHRQPLGGVGVKSAWRRRIRGSRRGVGAAVDLSSRSATKSDGSSSGAFQLPGGDVERVHARRGSRPVGGTAPRRGPQAGARRASRARAARSPTASPARDPPTPAQSIRTRAPS
jgi:hypothetical protein